MSRFLYFMYLFKELWYQRPDICTEPLNLAINVLPMPSASNAVQPLWNIYCVLDKDFKTKLSYLILIMVLWSKHYYNNLILKMRKLRHREVKEVFQGIEAFEWWMQEMKSTRLHPEPAFLATTPRGLRQEVAKWAAPRTRFPSWTSFSRHLSFHWGNSVALHAPTPHADLVVTLPSALHLFAPEHF